MYYCARSENGKACRKWCIHRQGILYSVRSRIVCRSPDRLPIVSRTALQSIVHADHTCRGILAQGRTGRHAVDDLFDPLHGSTLSAHTRQLAVLLLFVPDDGNQSRQTEPVFEDACLHVFRDDTSRFRIQRSQCLSPCIAAIISPRFQNRSSALAAWTCRLAMLQSTWVIMTRNRI